MVTGLSLATNTGKLATAGNHSIVASGGSAANYNITAVNGTLSVGKAALTVTAEDKTKVYGDPDPLLTYRADPLQLKYADSLDVVSGIKLSAPAGIAATVGSHPILTSGGAAANYTVTTGDGTLTVLPATLTVAAQSVSREFGAPNPAFTAVLNGYRYGQNGSILGGLLQFLTPAVAVSEPGVYGVLPYGLSAGNYQFNYLPGTLTVSRTVAPSVVTVNELAVTPTAALSGAMLAPSPVFGNSQIVIAPSSLSQLNQLPSPASGTEGTEGSLAESVNTSLQNAGATGRSATGGRNFMNGCFGQGIFQRCGR